MELLLIVAMPSAAAADKTGSVTPENDICHWSMSMAETPAMVTRMNVRRPAEWRLLERSQPMTAEKRTLSATRSRMEPSPSVWLHGPSQPAIRSYCIAFTSSDTDDVSAPASAQGAVPQPPP